MESFTILCTTCRARLKVRDRSAIGQIVSCPKCKGMVLVEPPAPGAPGDDAARAGDPGVSGIQLVGATPPAARGDEAFAQVDSLFSDGGPASGAPRQSAEATQPAGSAPSNSAAPSDRAPLAAAAALAVAQPLPPLPANLSDPPPPSADWATPGLRPWRQWFLLGGAAVSGLVLAAGLFAFFVASQSTTPPQAQADGGKRNGDARGPGEVASDAGPADAQHDHVAGKRPLGGDGPPHSLAPDAPRPAPETPPAIAPEDKIAQPPAVQPAPKNPPAAPSEIAPAERAPVGLPPTELAPAERGPAAVADKPELPSLEKPPADALHAKSLLAELKEFAPFLEPAASVDVGPRPPGEEESGPLPSEWRLASKSLPRPEPRKINVAERLADPIVEIETRGAALADFLRFIGDASTLPITIEPEALALLEVSSRAPIDVRLRDATVGQALQAALAPLKLGYVREGDQLVVTRAGETESASATRLAVYPLDDLAKTEAELDALTEAFTRLVAPGGWSEGEGGNLEVARGGGFAWKITQTEPLHYETLLFCERLRLARGLPPRAPRFAEHCALTPRHARAEALLATRLSLNYVRPTRLVDILARVTAETKLEFHVDWRALGDIGWTPDAEMRFTCADRPLSEALPALLEPMELGCRVLGRSAVQVTTRKALSQRLEVEFHPADVAPADASALLDEIRSKLGPERFDTAGGAWGLHWDAASRHLLAAVPSDRHARLREVIAEWRAGKP